MATEKQRRVARENIKKAQAKWRSMSAVSPRKQKSGGHGKFFRIVVRPKSEFQTFRTQDVGDKGGLERVAGKRSNGNWDTVSWLIAKEDAHIDEHDHLIIDDAKVRTVWKQVRNTPEHIGGDVFRSKPKKRK